MVKFRCDECGSLVLTASAAGKQVVCRWCDSRIRVQDETPFTEEDWLTHYHAFLLLQFARLHASDRKLWLFCYACVRRILDRVLDAVDLAERRVGSGNRGRQALAATKHLEAVGHFLNSGTGERSWSGELSLTAITSAIWGRGSGSLDQADVNEQLALLRDIVGNPFRPVTLRPALLEWDGGTVVKLARSIYDGRTFGDVPVLADALEEAGAPDELVSHLRGPGPHVRGCWVVDLLLGKE